MRLFLSTATTGGLAIFIALSATADSGPVISGNAYQETDLVSNGFIVTPNTDPLLVNPWGIAFNPAGNVWVADNGSGVSTLYDGFGVPNPLIVTIPSPPGDDQPSTPNGITFNNEGGFVVSKNGVSGSAAFLFSTEDGTISGWNPTVDRTHAILAVDNSANGTVYKGLAIGGNGDQFRLYATDFHNNRVDVFDNAFHPVVASGGFADPTIQQGFAPFGIANILGNIYVTYAFQDDERHDDVAGVGLGYVNVFDNDGRLIRRVATGGSLNAPWGLALAPANFGRFSGRLLVGNFGDGLINAFDLAQTASLGFLRAPGGEPLKIPGLWGIAFGNGTLHQPTNTLFFAAGPNEEQDGVYGRIEALPGGPEN